jgi:methionyl-tRNA formyltransferase
MKILFMGRKHSAAKALEWTVQRGYNVVGVITDDHLFGSPTAKVAENCNLPIFNLSQVYGKIHSGDMEVDLVISFLYWKILKKPLVGFPRCGIINFHPAPLPQYKGTAGYNVAILNDLNRWGVTAHYVDEGVDTGPIIDTFDFSIDSDEETAVSLEAKSQEFLVALYKKTLKRANAEGILGATKNLGGKYISRKKMEEMKRIVPGDNIDKKIRAFWFPPYSGATISIAGNDYTVINQTILDSLKKSGQTNI